MRAVNDQVKEAVQRRAISVDYRVYLYPTAFAYPSDGIREDQFYVLLNGESAENSYHILSYHYHLRGFVLNSNYRIPVCRVHIGKGVPLGISESMIRRSDGRPGIWGVRWSGFINSSALAGKA